MTTNAIKLQSSILTLVQRFVRIDCDTLHVSLGDLFTLLHYDAMYSWHLKNLATLLFIRQLALRRFLFQHRKLHRVPSSGIFLRPACFSSPRFPSWSLTGRPWMLKTCALSWCRFERAFWTVAILDIFFFLFFVFAMLKRQSDESSCCFFCCFFVVFLFEMMFLSSISVMVLSAFDPSPIVDNDSIRLQLIFTITTRIILLKISISFFFNLHSNSFNYNDLYLFDIFK